MILSDPEQPRVELPDIGAPRPALEDELAHELARAGGVLDAPAGVGAGDPEAGDVGGGAHYRRAATARTLTVISTTTTCIFVSSTTTTAALVLVPPASRSVLRHVAGLLRDDGGGGERRADGGEVADHVVALGLVDAHEVGRVGQGHGAVGLAAGVDLAVGTGVDLGVDGPSMAAAAGAPGAMGRHPVGRQRDVREDGPGADSSGEDDAVGAQALDGGARQHATGPGARSHHDVRHAVEGARHVAARAVRVAHARDGRAGLVQADPRRLGQDADVGSGVARQRRHGVGEVQGVHLGRLGEAGEAHLGELLHHVPVEPVEVRRQLGLAEQRGRFLVLLGELLPVLPVPVLLLLVSLWWTSVGAAAAIQLRRRCRKSPSPCSIGSLLHRRRYPGFGFPGRRSTVTVQVGLPDHRRYLPAVYAAVAPSFGAAVLGGELGVQSVGERHDAFRIGP